MKFLILRVVERNVIPFYFIMSVSIQHLTKIYGTQKAVDDISFEVKAGEVIGFLGPNGAGKSTTMKILTCFIPQTEGTASVCGFDVTENPMEVRKNIGYLPEHNPLYLDMFVREFLEFVAGVHQLKNCKKKIDEMIEMTGLAVEQKKKIGALSKGFRQRVGLAQAMIHNPDVLIFDEPTSGLDPNQIVEIRNLIKNLGKEKTVMLSTHIMQEVQAICNRVIIINKGKIVADDKTENLQQRAKGETIITVEFKQKVNPDDLKKIKEIEKVKNLGDNKWQMTTNSNEDMRETIYQFAVQNNLTILSMNKETQSLEEVFQNLTKET